jgi:hypothetical protein
MTDLSNASTNQHYVPQLLLRGFAVPKRKQLYVFDKRGDKVFRSSVRKLACERGFYEYADGTAPGEVDQWLQTIEGATAPIIDSMRSRRTLDHLLPAERKWSASFIAVQMVRTRQHREISGDINKQMADALREMGAKPNEVGNFRELSEAEVRDTSIANLRDSAVSLLPHLMNKSWILLAAPPETEFWIGDHPVALANNINPGDGIRGTLGLAVRGIEVYLPISSRLTLGCLCPTIPVMFAAAKARLIAPAIRETRADEFLESFTGRTSVELDAENVKYHNSLQAIDAERFVFSQHGDFGMLGEMLASDPALKRGPRVEMVGRRRVKD